MRLAGVNELFDYNRMSSVRREIPQIDAQTLQDQLQVQQGNSEDTLPSYEGRERKILDTKDVISNAVENHMNRDKDLIGRTKDIQQLDVERAISGMRKDSILQEYQYFVGGFNNSDGSVKIK